MNWYKIASYSYVEDILNTLRRFYPIVSQWETSQGKSLATGISARFTEISRLSESQYGTEEYKRLIQALIEARAFLSTASRLMQKEEEYPNLVSDFEETRSDGTKAGWLMWEREGNIKDKVKVIKDKDNKTIPPQIVLMGLNLGNSEVAQFIDGHMGGWAWQKEDGVHVRGTRESWDRFLSVSNQWLENHKVLKSKSMTLPFEKEFDPAYQEEVVENKSKPGEGFPLSVVPLNMEGVEGSISIKEQMRGRVYPGIRLSFDPEDPNLYDIRDYIVGVGRKNFIFNRPEGYFDIFEQGDVKGIEGLNKKTSSAVSLNKIKLRLRYLGYDNTTAIGPLITAITGVTPETSRKRKAKITRRKGQSDRVVRGRIRSNLFLDENLSPQLLVSNRFNVPEGQSLSQDQYNSLLEQNYPEAFGEFIPERQKEMQKNGMYFMASRTTSILADEPGSGKTPMAVVAADSTRNEGQKILVISPNMLVRENWIDVDEKGQPIAKAPGQFCGHNAGQIAVCKSPDELMEAVTNPEVIWVITPFSSFSSKGAKTEALCNNIVKSSRKGLFSSVIIDEIQLIKTKLGATTFKKIAKAITPYHIPHRVGLTGTPSDNKPEDIYSQLLLLDHPVLYDDGGIEKWTQSLSQQGFTDRFLGGEELSKSVSIPREIRETSSEAEIEKYREGKWFEKAKKVLEWVETLDDSKKLLILDLFSSTYLRRTKKDIRPDIPPKNRNVVRIPMPTDVDIAEGVNWHGTLLMDMAERKVPHTIKMASSVLSANPSDKVFIVTKHPKIAKTIAKELNNIHGKGTSAAVHGKTSDDNRSIIAREFKRTDRQGLRAVVYTMQLGAVGLNFDVASTCIFNDLDWNPSNDLQAEYRIHRITSKNPVDIKYVIFGDSYDEEMFNRVQKKELINNGVSDMIRQANMTDDKDPERLSIANNFIKGIMDSILLDVDLSVEHQAWFDQQLDIVLGLQGAPIQNQYKAPVPYPTQQPTQQVASNWYARRKHS